MVGSDAPALAEGPTEMIEIARSWRTISGGIAAGVVGVVMAAGGTATAEPLIPQPTVPGQVQIQPVTPPAQNSAVFPGGANSNRLAPAPAQAPGIAQAPLPAQAAVPAAVPAAAPPAAPVVTGTLREYLESRGVKLEAQRPLGFKALDISVPMPARWTQVPDPNVPDAFVVIADRVGGTSVYTSNAQVVVYKLIGDFDPAEAAPHGLVDSQRLLGWQTTNASLANFGTFPSAVIEGTYRENDMTLNTSRRQVLASAGPDKYLVSLSVTTAASQAIADATATDAIISGFRVGTPGSAPAAPARAGLPAAPAPVPATHGPAAPAPAAPAAPVVPAAPNPPAPAPLQAIRPVPRAVPGQVPAASPAIPAPSPAAAAPPLITLAPVPAH